MNQTQTRVWGLDDSLGRLSEFHTAVSLHSHTFHSKENLGFLPLYYNRVPILNRQVQSRLKSYKESKGITIDFSNAYWTPPVSPRTVLASEKAQIEEQLGLPALVSITDHDTIAAHLSWDHEPQASWVPISLEWTVPFQGNSLHLGVHNLPAASAADTMKVLAGYTAQPSENKLADILAFLNHNSDTLVVLNHPLWNIYRVSAYEHERSIRNFLGRYQRWIHALELNGLNSSSDNQTVLRMAEDRGLPVVGGGDRHGCRPNRVLNLTPAENWSDYVAQIRVERRSNILLLPAYQEPVGLRHLEAAADVLRRYPHYPDGRRRFADRIFVELKGYGWRPLSFYWESGEPMWLRPALFAVMVLGSDPLRHLLRFFMPLG